MAREVLTNIFVLVYYYFEVKIMPIIRKLIKVGDSRAVTIPPSWLEYYEKQRGEPIEEVFMELNGEIKIYVRPKDENHAENKS